MIQDSDREPSDALQQLSECLCDEEKIPLFHDSSFNHVSLCYKALPNYEALVQKRRERVERRLEEGRAAERAEKRARHDERETEALEGSDRSRDSRKIQRVPEMSQPANPDQK